MGGLPVSTAPQYASACAEQTYTLKRFGNTEHARERNKVIKRTCCQPLLAWMADTNAVSVKDWSLCAIEAVVL